jgi:hypothetical protein
MRLKDRATPARGGRLDQCFVEVLFNSASAQVLQMAVFLLAELASREAVALIFLLSPSVEQLALVRRADEADTLNMCVKLKSTSAILLSQILLE